MSEPEHLMIALAGISIDYARALKSKSVLQAVLDSSAAAAAGARLPATANQNRARHSLAACNVGISTHPDLSGAKPEIDANNVTATVASSATVETVILKIIGVNSMQITARASARSQIENGGVACLVALRKKFRKRSAFAGHQQGVVRQLLGLD